MNYLAHLALAQDNAHSRIGNLLGDFRRNLDIEQLPQRIYNGLQNHYLVDKTTDGHASVKNLKAAVSPQRRRYAGIIIDIAFDYFLCKHWDMYIDQDFDDFTEDCYCQLTDHLDDIPASMQPAVQRMIRYDWLHAYHTLEGVERAIDRVAERLRFNNRMAGGIQEVEANLQEFETVFNELYPCLQRHVEQAGLES